MSRKKGLKPPEFLNIKRIYEMEQSSSNNFTDYEEILHLVCKDTRCNLAQTSCQGWELHIFQSERLKRQYCIEWESSKSWSEEESQPSNGRSLVTLFCHAQFISCILHYSIITCIVLSVNYYPVIDDSYLR